MKTDNTYITYLSLKELCFEIRNRNVERGLITRKNSLTVSFFQLNGDIENKNCWANKRSGVL